MLELNTNMIVIAIVISLLFTLFNVLIIKWKNATPDESGKISKLWHKVGFIIHFFIVLQLFLAGGWLWGIIGFFTVWFIHNIIIAVGLGKKWYYVGTTSWFDIQIRKIFKNINFDK